MIVSVFCLFDATVYVDAVWLFIIELTHLSKKKKNSILELMNWILTRLYLPTDYIFLTATNYTNVDLL